MGRYDEIMHGLQEAIDIERGKKGKAVTHKLHILDVPDFTAAEIKAVRNAANMTQSTFAACIGVTKKAVEAWECGRTKPDGAARRLIGLLSNNPHFAETVGIIQREDTTPNKGYTRRKAPNMLVAEN